MKELEILVDALKAHLKAKEAELRENQNFNLYTEDALANRQREIAGFEAMIKASEKNPFHKSEVIKNFTEGADVIRKEIDKISC